MLSKKKVLASKNSEIVRIPIRDLTCIVTMVHGRRNITDSVIQIVDSLGNYVFDRDTARFYQSCQPEIVITLISEALTGHDGINPQLIAESSTEVMGECSCVEGVVSRLSEFLAYRFTSQWSQFVKDSISASRQLKEVALIAPTEVRNNA